MFLVDTNAISEARKARTSRGDRNVATWFANVQEDALFLSAITIQELEIGILYVERKDAPKGAVLRRWMNEFVLKNFRHRILSVDTAVAIRAAQLEVRKTPPRLDNLIAATAYVHGFSVVTRNVDDFVNTGVNVINPWIAP